MSMLKDHLRVKMAMNTGRSLRKISGVPGAGRAVLWIILLWIGMIILVLIAKKFNMM